VLDGSPQKLPHSGRHKGIAGAPTLHTLQFGLLLREHDHFKTLLAGWKSEMAEVSDNP
jgi:hypothetical protein